MAEQIISKRCSRCKEIKPLSEFYRTRAQKDGHQHYCKVCNKRYSQSERGKAVRCKASKKYRQTEKDKSYQKAYQKAYRQSEKGKIISKKWFSQNPQYRKASNAVNYAIRAGKLPKIESLQCHYCPAKAEEYHHHKGYAKEYWLDVIPVCQKCHKNLP